MERVSVYFGMILILVMRKNIVGLLKHTCDILESSALSSLLSLRTSFTSSESMEAFLDVLAGSRGIALLAFKVEQTRACISCDLGFDALATETAYILFNILLVEGRDRWSLMSTLQQDISLGTKVTLDIHF